MKKFTILLLGLIILSCENKERTFDRNNPNDPKGNAFEPREGDQLTAVLSNSGVANLNWPAADLRLDAYVVEKQIRATDDFHIIATLDADATNYADSTRFSNQTRYRVRGLLIVADELKNYIVHETSLNFGTTISPIQMNYSASRQEIDFIWSFRSPWITHIELSANYELENGLKRRLIQSPAANGTTSDALNDFDYENRTYAIRYLNVEAEDTLLLRREERVFNTREQIRIINFSAVPIHERRWELSWTSPGSKFISQITLAKQLPAPLSQQNDSELILLESDATATAYLDEHWFGPEILPEVHLNNNRMYTIVAHFRNTKSAVITQNRAISIQAPLAITINKDPSTQDVGRFEINWSIANSAFMDSILVFINFAGTTRRFNLLPSARSLAFTEAGLAESYQVRVSSFTTNPELVPQLNVKKMASWNFISNGFFSSAGNSQDAITKIRKRTSNGSELYVKHNALNGIEVFDEASRVLACVIEETGVKITDFELLNDLGKVVYVIPGRNEVKLADLPCGTNAVAITGTTTAYNRIEKSASEQFVILISDVDQRLSRMNLPNEEFAYTLNLSNVNPSDIQVAIHPDGSSLIVNESGTFKRFNAQTGTLVQSYTHSGALFSEQIGFSVDGSRFFAHLNNAFLFQNVGDTELDPIQISPNSVQYLMSGEVGDELIVFASSTISVYKERAIERLYNFGSVLNVYAALSLNAQRILLANENGQVHDWNRQSESFFWVGDR